MAPRMLTLALVVGTVLCVAASSLSAAHGRPPEVFLPVGLSGAIYVLSGYFVARRRPENRIGYALMLVGVVPVAFVILRYLFPVTEVANVAFGGSVTALLVTYLLLAFPSGYLAGRAERVAMTTLIVFFAVASVATLLTAETDVHGTSRCPPCVPNPLRVADLSVYPIVSDIANAGAVVASLAVAGLAVRRWRAGRGAARRVLAPVLFGGIVTALGYSLTSLAALTGVEFPLFGQVILTLRLLVPIGLAVVFVRIYASRGAVAASVVQLGASPSAEGLESALRRALRDPQVVVARWSAAAGGYLDREGHRVDPDELDGRLDAIRLERDGQPIAAVIHDAALSVDPALVRSLADAVRFAVDTTDLQDRLTASGGDIASLPRGEVTFLFGDIEGSTELLARIGDAYVDVLSQLRRIVRESASRHGGKVVEVRADECFVAFSDSAQGVAAAMEIQRRLAEAAWPEGEHPRLRIGVHVGTPNLTADGYVGLDVHLAARVMATGNGAQIMASGAVVASAGDRLPAGVGFVSLGTFKLRGIARPQALFRVTAPGTDVDTPPRAEPA